MQNLIVAKISAKNILATIIHFLPINVSVPASFEEACNELYKMSNSGEIYFRIFLYNILWNFMFPQKRGFDHRLIPLNFYSRLIIFICIHLPYYFLLPMPVSRECIVFGLNFRH